MFYTGTEVSAFPASSLDSSSNASSFSLVAANGSSIRTYGTRKVHIILGNQPYAWNFFVANVSQPLLGEDFLRHFALLVDVKHQKLVDTTSFHSVPTFSSVNIAPRLIKISSINDPFSRLLESFPSITTPSFSQSTVKHQVKHFILTEGSSVHAHARRFSPEKLAAAKTEFQMMEELGVIRRSNSPWASPLHVCKLRLTGNKHRS